MKSKQVSKTAHASFLLGLGSIFAIVISVIVAISIEAIGAASLFRIFVMPLSIAAIIVGVIARRDDTTHGGLNQRRALWGIILGAISLGIIVLAMIIVVVIFFPTKLNP